MLMRISLSFNGCSLFSLTWVENRLKLIVRLGTLGWEC